MTRELALIIAMILFILAALCHGFVRDPWPLSRIGWTLTAAGLFFLAWSTWPTLAVK